MKINPDGSTSPLGEKFVSASAKVKAYADAHAGGPGAIYIGDINQLVGPTSDPGQGDLDGMVPLDALQRQTYIYESDYYKGLIEKANFDNPTELVSTDANIEIQHACINRALGPCQSVIHYFAPQLEARTGGALTILVSSFPELGLAGPDTLALVSDGTIAMANIYGGYVGGALPPIEIQVLWGVYPDQKSEFMATAAITPDLEALVQDATGGGILINHNWFSGNDQFFFTTKPLNTLEDFEGLKTRSHGAALSDWIEGMGADAQFVAFAEVYTALERGILNAGVTGADAAYGQRWYEVTDYINGPLISFPSTNNVINGKVWDKIPPDLQQIFIEEGARSELEALRIASIQNEMGLLRNTLAGLEYVPFSDELKKHSFEVAVLQHVVPAWVRKVGGPDAPMVKVFNEKVSPIVGLYIEDDGSVTITKAR
jgi:TRAP-type C4-dicarboxylate transport system substrate-binding protein